MGITGGTLRMSVELGHIDDLIADFDQAMVAVRTGRLSRKCTR